jgi:hypothetical protein
MLERGAGLITCCGVYKYVYELNIKLMCIPDRVIDCLISPGNFYNTPLMVLPAIWRASGARTREIWPAERRAWCTQIEL